MIIPINFLTLSVQSIHAIYTMGRHCTYCGAKKNFLLSSTKQSLTQFFLSLCSFNGSLRLIVGIFKLVPYSYFWNVLGYIYAWLHFFNYKLKIFHIIMAVYKHSALYNSCKSSMHYSEKKITVNLYNSWY